MAKRKTRPPGTGPGSKNEGKVRSPFTQRIGGGKKR